VRIEFESSCNIEKRVANGTKVRGCGFDFERLCSLGSEKGLGKGNRVKQKQIQKEKGLGWSIFVILLVKPHPSFL